MIVYGFGFDRDIRLLDAVRGFCPRSALVLPVSDLRTDGVMLVNRSAWHQFVHLLPLDAPIPNNVILYLARRTDYERPEQIFEHQVGSGQIDDLLELIAKLQPTPQLIEEGV